MSDTSSTNLPVKLLSEAISSPIIKAHQEGGLALVFILIGTLLMLGAFFFGISIFGVASLVIGSLIILVIVSFFYFQSIRPLQQLNAQIKRNQEIIDTVQSYALKMAEMTRDFNKLTIWYVNDVVTIITKYQQIADVVIPLLQKFPIPGSSKIVELVDNKYVIKADALSRSILLTTHEAEEIIDRIHRALHDADLDPLKEYLTQVQDLDQKLKGILSIEADPQPGKLLN